MVGDTSKDPGWPAEILGFGNHDMRDTGRGLQAAAAQDSRVGGEHAKLLRLEVPVLGFSILSRRRLGLTPPDRPGASKTEHTHLVVDSTGLQTFGEIEW